MITFGYKNRFNGPIRALVALAIGIVMVVSRADAMVLVVRIIAAFLLASGLVSMAVAYKHKKQGDMPLMGFNSVVDVLLALMIFIWPEFVAGLIMYLIGFVLIGFGIFQLIALISANKVMPVGPLAFVLPSLVLAGGAILILNPGFIGSAIGIVAGVALILYGLSELLSSWKMKKAMDEYDIHNYQDVNKIDEQTIDEQTIDEQ